MKTTKSEIFFYLTIVALLLGLVASARSQANQTSELQMIGGAFTMAKTVVAGGGQTMGNAPMSASTTTGQAAAGKTSTGGTFSLYSGFWTPDDFIPSASTAIAGGRVTTADGRGIRNARIVVTFPSGETRYAISGSFGYYSFEEIPVGNTYIFTVFSKRFSFVPASLVQRIDDDTRDINFVADSQIQ